MNAKGNTGSIIQIFYRDFLRKRWKKLAGVVACVSSGRIREQWVQEIS